MDNRISFLPWKNYQELLNISTFLLDLGCLRFLDFVMDLKFFPCLFTLTDSIVSHSQAIVSIG